jgi:hypothetical protein
LPESPGTSFGAGDRGSRFAAGGDARGCKLVEHSAVDFGAANARFPFSENVSSGRIGLRRTIVQDGASRATVTGPEC